jgi:DNA ligase (NAD+)
MLLTRGMISDPADIYRITVDDLLPLEGWKETSASNLVSAIEASKNRPLAKLIFGLGIDHVGGTVAGVLASSFGSMDAIASASGSDIEAIDGVGPEIARSVTEWFADPDNRHLIERLGAAGVSLEDVSVATSDLPRTMEGMTVVITGTLSGFTRESAGRAVVDRGGKVTGSVSSRTDALIAGENAGSKLARAEGLGVPVLDEAGFVELLERGSEFLGS